MDSSLVLITPVLICLAGGLAAYILNRHLRVLSGLLALCVSAAALVQAARIFQMVRVAQTPLKYHWQTYAFRMGNLDLSVNLEAWRFSTLMLLGIAFFGVVVILYALWSMRRHEEPGKFYAFTLWALAGAFTVALANNWLLFVVGWEVVTVMLFLLLNLGDPHANKGAAKTFVLLGFADACILLGVALMLVTIPDSQTLSGMHDVPLDSALRVIIYCLLLVGALAKAGAMPMHTWLPSAAEHANAATLAFLPAAVDKLLGIYLLARISLQMFTIGETMRVVLLLIGAGTIICAVFMAMIQHNLKRLLAYHAVSQVGYMVLGLGTGTVVGIMGGLFHMVNNAIYKSCLFLGAGVAQDVTGETDLDRMGGLSRTMPVTFTAMLVAALSISGVPPLNGFVSKWMVYQGAITSGTLIAPVLLAVAVFGSALTLASFVKILSSMFFGTRPEGMRIRPAGAGVVLAGTSMVTLAGLCVLFGVWYALPVQQLIQPALAELRLLPAGEATVGVTVGAWPGIWSAGWATGLIVVGLALGLVVYLLGRVWRVRTVRGYMSGEVITDDRARFRASNFYRTVEDLPFIGTMLRDASGGAYDVHYVFGKYGQRVVDLLKGCHTGVLPLYVTWVLVGLVIILLYLL